MGVLDVKYVLITVCEELNDDDDDDDDDDYSKSCGYVHEIFGS